MNLNKINLDRVKGILIDLDDTVYNYQKCHDFALDKTYKIACSLIKKEIIELGETPVKRKTLQPGREYIEDLKVQKEILEKEKAKQAKIDAVKNGLMKIEAPVIKSY